MNIFEAGVLFKIFKNGVDCNFCCFCKGVTVCTGGDGRESNGFAVVFNSEIKRFDVALTEKFCFVGKAVVPNGANGMDNIFCVKFEAGGNYSIAGFASALGRSAEPAEYSSLSTQENKLMGIFLAMSKEMQDEQLAILTTRATQEARRRRENLF